MLKHKKINLKTIILLFFLLIIFILISVNSYVEAISFDLQETVFRLHVIANSNSEEDQNLKYIVRDSVLEYLNTVNKNIITKEELINFINENSDKIEYIAQQTVYDNGYNYDINLEIGNFMFPTKTYGDISFPPGYYNALKIKIGKANGQNWWCVMFPPLCFVDVTSGIVPDDSKEILEESLLEEEYNLISNNTTTAKVKFKIIEMFQNITAKINS